MAADESGALVTGRLLAEDVDVHSVVDPGAPTGLLIKERRTAALRRVLLYCRDASTGSRLRPADLPGGLVEAADILYVTGITLALSADAAVTVHAAVGRAATSSTTVCLDVDHRSRPWTAEKTELALGEAPPGTVTR